MGKTLMSIFAILSIVCVNGYAVDLTLQELKNKLSIQDDATWQAADTELSRLSFKEAKQRMGAILPDGFGEFFENLGAPTRFDGPNKIDWRDVKGVNYTTPIMNQGRCGSCVAFAAVATMETQLNITRKRPSSPWAFSAQHLFSCGGGGCDMGWQPHGAISYLKNTGIPDEACFPYQSGALGEDMACSKSCGNASARSEKIIGSTMPTFFLPNPSAVKAALAKGPLIAVMRVAEDFLFYKSGVYKHTTGKVVGGHAVTLVGYDDANSAWILQNSWGEEWGEKGYFRVHYDDSSGIGVQTYGVEVSEGNGYVSLGGLRDYTVLSGTTKLNLESTYQSTQALEWTLSKAGQPVGWGTANRNGALELDTTKYADGVYTLQATARHDSQTSESQPRTVHILNSQFKGAIKVTNLTAGEVVEKEKKIDFNVEASPIPFSKIVFSTKNLSTGEVSLRATGVSFPKMRSGWRAQYVPNGKYEIQFLGYVGDKLVHKTSPVAVEVKHD